MPTLWLDAHLVSGPPGLKKLPAASKLLSHSKRRAMVRAPITVPVSKIHSDANLKPFDIVAKEAIRTVIVRIYGNAIAQS